MFVNESLEDLLKPKDLSPTLKLMYAVSLGNMKYFIDLLAAGEAKLSYRVVRSIYINPYARRDLKRWIELLDEATLKKYCIPHDFEKIKNLIPKPELEHKSYPRGYKQYRVLKEIRDKNITKRVQLVKLIYELGYGPGTYNPVVNSSYWSTSWNTIVGQYYDVDYNSKRFYLTEEGVKKLEELEKKFGKNNSIKPYV